jgi:hypothetical protein
MRSNYETFDKLARPSDPPLVGSDGDVPDEERLPDGITCQLAAGHASCPGLSQVELTERRMMKWQVTVIGVWRRTPST